ncbi:acyl carrier protein [Acinetobacter johnsonii]|uniref:acyl carrier protein n=1 Tax=Acinetobacter johnsonii TaxID=40214 RepID=UPI003AF4E2A2
MKDKILNFISKASKHQIDDLSNNLNAEGLWDSLTHVELIVMLEEEFDIFFDENEIALMRTPAKVIELTQQKVEYK